MSLYLLGRLKLLAYRDSTQTEFPTQKVVDMDEEFSNTSVDETIQLYINLAASGSQVINLDGVSSPQGIYVYSDTSNLSLDFDSLGNITYTAQKPGYFPIQFSSLTVTNASASAATNVQIIIVTG